MKQIQRRARFSEGHWLISSLGFAALLLPACQGSVGGPEGGDVLAGAGGGTPGGGSLGSGGAAAGATAGAAGTSTVPGGGGATVPVDCATPKAAAVTLRLLSADQYDNTVLDMLKVAGDPAAGFGDKVFEQLDDTRVEQRANAAAEVARQAAATLSKWAPCTPPATGDASACERQIIEKVGASAFRHPLSAEENTQMKALFDAGIAEKDFATGVEWFLTGVLQSPDFMYEVTRPSAQEAVGQSVPLAPYEYASRASYFLWDSLPDDQLLTAAAANELGDQGKRQAQLTRMVGDQRFMRGVERFYSHWLNVSGLAEVARDAPGFTGDVVTALSTSLLKSATELYSSATPSFSSLFSGDTYYMNDKLRTFYGVTGSGTDFAAVKLSNQARQGIVTHPALMAMMARPEESFPIARGLFVLRTLLCGDVPQPAGLEIPEVPPIQEGLSTRDRFEAHVSQPLCSSCHVSFDPLGFALENFDEVGKYRTMDHGKAVDTSGTVALRNDLDGPFANGSELLAKMANSPTAKACFAQQYLKFALSRQTLQPQDQCSVKALGESFNASGDLKQLLVAVASSDAFRLRLAEGVAP